MDNKVSVYITQNNISFYVNKYQAQRRHHLAANRGNHFIQTHLKYVKRDQLGKFSQRSTDKIQSLINYNKSCLPKKIKKFPRAALLAGQRGGNVTALVPHPRCPAW